MPLMTEEQWYLTNQIKGSHLYSPSVAEMIGSARPKIHALYQLLLHRHFALTKVGESAYAIQFKTVKFNNQVILLYNYITFRVTVIFCINYP